MEKSLIHSVVMFPTRDKASVISEPGNRTFDFPPAFVTPKSATVLSLRFSALRRGKKIAVGTVLVFVLLVGTLMSSYYAPSVFHRGF